MFAIPVVRYVNDDKIEFTDGGLIRLIPELSGEGKIKNYAALERPGWHKIDFDYFAYVYSIGDYTRYCFPGLCPTDENTRNKYNVPRLFSKFQIEKYIEVAFSREEEMREEIERDLNLVVHDLRRLSSAIYHAATEALDAVRGRELSKANTRIENIISAQSMLKIRTDVLDFAGNPSQTVDRSHIPLYRRIDKVVKCFRATSVSQKLALTLNGSSFGTSYGPNLFEMIPYILVDNAIKYSPHNSEVEVLVSETADEIKIEIRSLGPDVMQHERKLIFEKGYRGEVARTREDSGSGLGLFLCKKIVDQFSGSIGIEVGNREYDTSNGPCRDIVFVASFPRSHAGSQ